MSDQLVPNSPDELVHELIALIDAARRRVATTVNSELVLLHWRVGLRLREEVVGEGRAAYGEQIVEAVARVLSTQYGRGYSKRNLYYMIRFAEVFPELEIVHAVRAQLSWTHIRELIAIDDPLKRDFYTELCRIERWSTRTLKSKIDGMLFERTAIAKRPIRVVEESLQELRDEQKLSPDLVFRDPYVLDFLGLPEDYSEQELEAAILKEIEALLLELGQGFSFIARQKRMSLGPDDFYLDLLFFHRPLRALVAIELKLGRFDARDKGQMELYLRWLDRHERQPDENPPLDKDAVIDLEEFIGVLKDIRGKFIAVLNDSAEKVAAFKKAGHVFKPKVREASGRDGAKQAMRLFCANYLTDAIEQLGQAEGDSGNQLCTKRCGSIRRRGHRCRLGSPGRRRVDCGRKNAALLGSHGRYRPAEPRRWRRTHPRRTRSPPSPVSPRIVQEADLPRLIRTLLRELKRQVIVNVSLSIAIDFDDTAFDGLDVVAIGKLPSLVLTGPRLRGGSLLRRPRRMTPNASHVVAR